MRSLNLPSIYEDSDLLVVNKPYGVVVNRAETYDGVTVQDWLAENLSHNVEKEVWQPLVPEGFDPQYGSPEEIFKERLGMVHRLDKDTSGALVLAKNPGALVSLLKQFKERTVQKTYLCLTHGKFAIDKGSVKLPIGRRPDNRKLFGIVPDGRPAHTDYQVLNFFQNFKDDLLDDRDRIGKRFSLYQGFSLVECQPKTGRTHQIRVHMKHLSHPIVGDSMYVGKKRSKLDSLWCPRQFLHASQVQFTHPRSGGLITASAPLPPDLDAVLQFIGE